MHYRCIEMKSEAVGVLIAKIRKDLVLNQQKQEQCHLEK